MLQFQPFSSVVDGTFWHRLSKNKLDFYQLDDSQQHITAYYTYPMKSASAARLNVSSESFDNTPRSHSISMPGILLNKNTIEDFKSADMNELLKQAATDIYNDIHTLAALENPQLLNRFLLLTFADLKKHLFYYWFCFPCLLPQDHFTIVQKIELHDYFIPEQMQVIHELPTKDAFFLMKKEENKLLTADLKDIETFFTNTSDKVFFRIIFTQ
jgi:ubiquitin-like modifier-activating enzyme ATG7